MKKPRVIEIPVTRRTLPYLAELNLEGYRVRKQFCTYVVRRLQSGDVPTAEDIAAALTEASAAGRPLPAALTEHVIATYVLRTHPQRPGRKRQTWTPQEALRVVAVYQEELALAQQAATDETLGITATGRARRNPVRTAETRTGARLTLSAATVRRLVKAHPIRILNP